MKTLTIIMAIFSTSLLIAQQKESKETMKSTTMKTYLIAREMPGIGTLERADLIGASQKSCSVLKEMGTGIEWKNSYVLDDMLYCVYKAENKELIKEHAEKGGFPCDKIMEIKTNIGPETAEEKVE